MACFQLCPWWILMQPYLLSLLSEIHGRVHTKRRRIRWLTEFRITTNSSVDWHGRFKLLSALFYVNLSSSVLNSCCWQVCALDPHPMKAILAFAFIPNKLFASSLQSNLIWIYSVLQLQNNSILQLPLTSFGATSRFRTKLKHSLKSSSAAYFRHARERTTKRRLCNRRAKRLFFNDLCVIPISCST